jgi:hypothetical protein
MSDEQAISRVVERLAHDPQPARFEISKVDAVLLMQSVLVACRHPGHAAMATHARVRDLAARILLDVCGGDADARALVEASLEGVP